MHYIELTFSIYLLMDIKFQESFQIIGQNINQSMLLDSQLSCFHHENKFKNYIFCSFYPVEKDKLYKAGRVYLFKLRTIDDVFAEKISSLLRKNKSNGFKVISVEKKKVEKHIITELFSITPVIITTDNNNNWVHGNDFKLLQRRLQDNLEKKYNNFYEDKLSAKGNFIERIEILNRMPISIIYKSTHFLGNKFKIYINENDDYQKMAFIAEAIGLGEKGSSVGSGFCNAQYLK